MPDLIKIAVSGALKDYYDIRNYRGKTDLDERDMPKEFSLDVSKLPVKLQVGGTCVAHSLANAVEYFNIMETGEYKKMSIGFIYGNRGDDIAPCPDEGMYVRRALSRLQKVGAVPFTDYPKERAAAVEVPAVAEVLDELAPKAAPYRIKEYYQVWANKDIKAALMSGHPVVFVVPWGVNNYIQQTFDGSERDFLILKKPFTSLHAMLIYGWNKDGWLIQNSHGSWWAGDGRTILPYGSYIDEAWGVVDYNNKAEQAIRVVHPNIPDKVAKFANKIFNLFYSKK